MTRMERMIERLAERYITQHLEAGREVIVNIDDLLASYKGFCGVWPTIPDEEFITMVLIRFPDAKINYSTNNIINLNWIRPKRPEPQPEIDLRTKFLDIRLGTFLNLYPRHVEFGFTAKEFKNFEKWSIVGGFNRIEIQAMDDLKEAEEFLSDSPHLVKKAGRYFPRES